MIEKGGKLWDIRGKLWDIRRTSETQWAVHCAQCPAEKRLHYPEPISRHGVTIELLRLGWKQDENGLWNCPKEGIEPC